MSSGILAGSALSRPGSFLLGVGGDFEIWGVQFRFLWGECCEIWAGPWFIRVGNHVFGHGISRSLAYPALVYLFFFSSGEVEQQRTPATISLLPGAEGEEAERTKETMELFPQSAGFGVKDAAAPRCVLLNPFRFWFVW